MFSHIIKRPKYCKNCGRALVRCEIRKRYDQQSGIPIKVLVRHCCSGCSLRDSDGYDVWERIIND